MAKRPVVLQVVPSLVSGGVERGTIEVATALAKNGYTNFVASSGGPMVRELEQVGVPHITLNLASKNPLDIYGNIARLAQVARDHKIDIIHARSRAPAWSAYAAAQQAKCHFITTFHNAYGTGNALKHAYNSVMARGERVIAISKFVGAYAQNQYNVPTDILRVIPRGVDIAVFDAQKVEAQRIDALRAAWGVQTGVPVILLPGRMTRWKGQLVLVEALAKLPTKNVQCIMIGKADADYEKEIRSMAEKYGVGAQVKIFDACKDMPAAYLCADIIVSPATRPEGFGRVIIEAQAMGRPVIATNHGGACETIIDGENGWLVPPDDGAALAKALDQVMRLSPDAQQKIAQQSINHIRTHFTTETMTKATLAVYNEVMQ